VTRWLALALGLSVAHAGISFLATRGAAPAPRERIGGSSRAALGRVLVEAEREGSGR
jgi:hypothetical protein